MTRIAQALILSFGWRRAAMLFVAGALGALSMPPLFFLPVLYLALPLWVWALDGAEVETGIRRLTGAPFQIGFFFGLGYFATSLHWIGAAFFVDGGWLLVLMPFAVLALAGVLALFWGLASALAHLFWSTSWSRVLFLALALSVAEFLRGHLFTGFPFNLLGYALTANEIMMQATSLVGIYGLTFIAALTGFLPALIWPGDDRGMTRRLMPLFTIFLVLAAQLSFGQYRLSAAGVAPPQDMRVRLVQPGVSQAEKWRPDNRDFILDRLISLSQSRTDPRDAGLDDITYLIWPEAALPFFPADYPQFLVRIAQMLPPGATLLTGSPRRQNTQGLEPQEFNSILAIGTEGEILDSYDKTHLVPFGEYLPFQPFFDAFGIRQFVTANRGWSAGESRRLMQPAKAPPFLPLICYEAIFSGDLGEGVDGAGFLLNLTNDAWFDNSIGPAQHFHHARVRAVEHGLPMIRVANTGRSAIIDPLGRLSGVLEPGQTGLVDASVPERLVPTFFSRFTNWPFLFMVVLGGVTGGITRYLHSRS